MFLRRWHSAVQSLEAAPPVRTWGRGRGTCQCRSVQETHWERKGEGEGGGGRRGKGGGGEGGGQGRESGHGAKAREKILKQTPHLESRPAHFLPIIKCLEKVTCRDAFQVSLVQLEPLYELQARPFEELLVSIESHGVTCEVSQVFVQVVLLEHLGHWGIRIDACVGETGGGGQWKNKKQKERVIYIPWCVLGLLSS